MWRALRSVLFWTFHRGSWQYDIIVLVILAFIFLTPKTLFDGSLLGKGPGSSVERPAPESLPVAAKPSPRSPEKEADPEPKSPKDPPGR